MKHLEINLNSNIIKIDLEDLSLFEKYTWYISEGYAMSGGNPTILLHRLILGYFGDLNVDHINRDRLDNRKENLRICTACQNHMNKGKKTHKISTAKKWSPYKGVRWHKNKNMWMTDITVNKKTHYIGLFHNEVEAAKAYDKKARELHKEFAYLNFPSEI